ncbi:FABP family protein [Actinomyces sp. B33]|uniref:FABP family protein n=1 Tax=Actinomyces sp. B33 TaxID=2942131 RepID=UPI00233FBBD8|nr:heme-binding beta-barrel domain-containing protein [Actinomyces sp. B33]MDC4233494.1 FABP family protein [Actinomyces sp. B33]
MMVIPADLPPSLAPLAWMLGTWKGWGMLAGRDDAPDTAVVEEIRSEICGTRMRLITAIRHGLPAPGVEIDPVWDAAEGLARIDAGDLVVEETIYIEVLPGSGALPPPGEYEPREFTGTGSDTRGLGVLWAGVGVGPRVQMVSDAIARGPRADEVTRLGRMFGLVAGEMMWTQERTIGSGEAAVEISGRLMRTERATTESGEAVEGIDADDREGRPHD